MIGEQDPTQHPTTKVDDAAVHDAILTLALHRYAVDRVEAGQQLRLRTVVHIAALARLRGLRPTSDVLLLGFELDGTVVQPLAEDVLHALEERIQDRGAADHLDWMCGFLIGKSPAQVEALVTADSGVLPKRGRTVSEAEAGAPPMTVCNPEFSK